MTAHVKVSGTWRTLTNLYVKVSGTWRNVSDGFVKVSGTWRSFFTSALTPSIASQVTIATNSSSYPATLTGTNFNWTNSTSLTYVFQKSSDNVTFTNIGSAQSISNPAVSNTVTYALTLSDFPAFTSYFRFSVTATNSTYGTSATSTSSSVTVNKGAPINTVAPVISPTSGTVGVTTYSVTSNGSWDPDDSDGIYAYQWQSFDTPTYITAPGTSTNSTYTPPSNFFTLGYQSPIRCRVTATNGAGSTSAFSNPATVSPALTVPSAPQSLARTTGDGLSKTFTWSAPSSNGGTAITGYEYSVNGGSSYVPTSSSTSQSYSYSFAGSNTFHVRAVNSVGAGPAASLSFVLANIVSGPSASSITTSSATISWSSNSQSTYSLSIPGAPSTPYTGTTATSRSITGLSAGTTYTPTLTITSSTGDTHVVTGASFTTTVAAPVNIVAPSVTPTSGTAGTTTYSCTTGTWTNSPTSYLYQWQYNDQGATFLNISGATSSTYSPPSNFFTFYLSPIRCRVTAINAGAPSGVQAFSNTASVSPALSPPSGGTVTLTGTGVAGTSITATTSGWSNSPTSYSVRIYASTSSSPTTSDTLKASSSTSSVSYTVTTFDASPPPFYFRAFATATNAAGTSSEVASNIILSSLGGLTTPGTPTMTYDSANSTASNWAYDISWTASTGSGTIQYQLDCQASNDQSTILSTATRPSSGFYSSSSQQDVLLSRIYTFWRCRVRATNDGGSTWTSYSAYSNWA
jgi:hypothetical protein